MPVMAVGGPGRPFNLILYGRTVLLSLEYSFITQINSVLIRQMIIPVKCVPILSFGIQCRFKRAGFSGDAIYRSNYDFELEKRR